MFLEITKRELEFLIGVLDHEIGFEKNFSGKIISRCEELRDKLKMTTELNEPLTARGE
jgi:hypothetical protein